MNFNRKLINELYKNHDEAHRSNHIEDVHRNALNILKVNKHKMTDVLMNAIMFHDITAAKDRDNHHNSGAQWVIDNAERYNIEDAEAVAQCIREHRGSFKGAFTSIESEILSSADRGTPDSAMKLCVRSYNYARTKEGKEHDDALFHAIEHINAKYGPNGYGRYPDMYVKTYGKEIKGMHKELAELTCDDLDKHIQSKTKR
ncbi:MAG: hypothetical protein ACRCZ9_08935 [Fusobacteriaceae bacterium]